MRSPTILLITVFFSLFIAASSVAVDIATNDLGPSGRAPDLCPASLPTGTQITDPGVYNDLMHYYRYAYGAYSEKCVYPHQKYDNGKYLRVQTHINGNLVEAGRENKSTDTQAYIAIDKTRKEYIIAFRGTSTLKDFWTDSKTDLRTVVNPRVPAGVRVHGGFADAYESIWSGLDTAMKLRLKQQETLKYSIVFVGHSLGGALASLSAANMKSTFTKDKMDVPIRVYTYGQPRTGDKNYVDWIESTIRAPNLYRSVNRGDFIPHLPPQLYGYMHHGVEYWTCGGDPNAAGTLKCSLPEQPQCSRDTSYVTLSIGERPHRDYFGIADNEEFCIQRPL